MKIRRKIFLSFILQLIIGISVLGGVMIPLVVKQIQNEIFNHLDTVAESRAKHLEAYFEQNIERLKLINNQTKLRSTLAHYNQAPNEEDKETMRQIIVDAAEPISDFEWICILDLNGRVIVSTNENYIGRDCKGKDFFEKAKNDYVISFEEEDGEIKMYVTGPYTLGNQFLGVGITVANLDTINLITSQRSGLGETGEVLLAKKGEDGVPVFLNERKFVSDLIIDESKKVAQPMKEALYGQEGHFKGTLDYRGEKVLSATKYIKNFDLGLIVKIDQGEALKPANNLVLLFFVLSFIYFIIYYFITTFVSKLFTKPIEELREVAEKIKAGNLNQRASLDTKDEIRDLADSFNQMIDVLKKSRADIDKQVNKQTQEIEERSKEIRDQQKAVLNILEDVQEEKDNVTRERNKIDKILHSIGDGVFVVDKNLNITIFNQIAADISGFSIKESIGKRYNEVLKFYYEDTGKVNNDFINKAFETGEVQEMTNHTVLIRKDKTEVAVADSAAPLKGKDGEVIGCVVVFRDVSKEREIDKAKTEFVSLASHQLRTPLSAINWYAEMLIAGDAGNLKGEQLEYVKEIYHGNQRMVDLVNALLDTSRIELGTFTVEPEDVSLTEISGHVLKELDPKAKEKKLKLSCKIDKKIDRYYGDPKLLNIIFQNLLSNAVKYTPEKGTVNLEIKKEGDDILFIFSDTGMGIPKRQQDKIFTKLFRADNVKETDTEGTGLGLYIIKSIVEHSGGKIWFDSKENKGTTFYIKLSVHGMKKKEGSKQLGS